MKGSKRNDFENGCRCDFSVCRRDYVFDDSSIEVINENTEGHYRELPDGRMTLGGDVIEASKEWVLELPVTGLKARNNNLIIYVDG